jgi:hypothetical protein
MHTSSEATMTESEQNESVIDQSPKRVVGDRVYVSVPGPVPMVRVKKRRSGKV